MGTLIHKKKAAIDINNIIAELKTLIDLDTNRAALQPSTDPLGYSPQIYSMIDFVNVTDTIGPGQSTS